MSPWLLGACETRKKADSSVIFHGYLDKAPRHVKRNRNVTLVRNIIVLTFIRVYVRGLELSSLLRPFSKVWEIVNLYELPSEFGTRRSGVDNG